jgi:hypothetical protein
MTMRATLLVMTPRALPALLAVSLVLGCTVTTTKADADAPKPNTSADSSDADAPKPNPESEPEPSDPKPARAPVPRAELADCPAEQGTAIANYCTDDGKLAGSWVPVDTLKVPDEVEIIFNAEGPDATKQTSLMIATRGDELYIKQVTCGACRRVLGQGFAGHLSHMSEAQLRELQKQLGLGDDMPVLESTEKWTSFCGDERGKGTLTALASKAESETGTGRGR